MKGSLTVVAFFCAGCLMGVANDFQFDLHDYPCMCSMH